MTKDRQIHKVRLFRTLKVVFYCLGLPLFFFATFLASLRFMGVEPFTGTTKFTSSLGFFMDMEEVFAAPALYGLWIAGAIWIVISIVHIIMSRVVKSRRVRMFSVLVTMLVVMMGTMFILDGVFEAKIKTLQTQAAEVDSSIVVDDYKKQLSYYRTISSNNHGSNRTEQIVEKIALLKKVYNIEMEAMDLGGTAGNISSKPATYANVIDDDGNIGVDMAFRKVDGVIKFVPYDPEIDDPKYFGIKDDIEGQQVITHEIQCGSKQKELKEFESKPLTIDGKTFSYYKPIGRQVKKDVGAGKKQTWEYVWYPFYYDGVKNWEWSDADSVNAAYPRMLNEGEPGAVYGAGKYNMSGLLRDGYVFGLDNVLNILESYYEAKDAIENGISVAGEKKTAAEMAADYVQIYNDALVRRDKYYTGQEPDANGEYCPAWIQALYRQEVTMSERFSLTRGEIDELLAKVGGLLGDNALFDYLLFNADNALGDYSGLVTSLVGKALGDLFVQLNNGMSLKELLGLFIKENLDGTMTTVIDILKTLTNKEDWTVNDLYITAAYKATDALGRNWDHLYIAILADDGAGNIGGEDRILLDIDFDDALLNSSLSEYAFDMDRLSNFLNVGLNNLLDKYNINLSSGIISTLANLILKDIKVGHETYKGLVIAGMVEIPILHNGRVELDIIGIVQGLLKNWYCYQSAYIKPVWEFYVDPDNIYEIEDMEQMYFANYDRAYYTAVVQGNLISSVLIGDKLGNGVYPSSFGLGDLASVRQLQWDLKYIPTYYPLFSLRDMLANLSAICILFYFMSFVASQKEEDYACGKLVPKERRSKKRKKSGEVIDEETYKMMKGEGGDGAPDGTPEEIPESEVPKEGDSGGDIPEETPDGPPVEAGEEGTETPEVENKEEGVL